jgi:hypothetical protein
VPKRSGLSAFRAIPSFPTRKHHPRLKTKHRHGTRFRDALAIVNPGACNPSGIAHPIVDACREIREHEPTASTAQDPAVRLMGAPCLHSRANLVSAARFAFLADRSR